MSPGLNTTRMSLGLRIYAIAGIAFLILCFALVGAMVVDTQRQTSGMAEVISSVGAGRGD